MIYSGYIIKPSERFPGLLTVATEGQGGKIPNVLSGMHTSYHEVQKKIDMYLETQKGKTNGKTSTKGGD